MGIPVRDRTPHSSMFANVQVILTKDKEDMGYIMKQLSEA
jgi:hypothetical protein